MSLIKDSQRNAFLILAHEDAQMIDMLAERLSKLGKVYLHLDIRSEIDLRSFENSPNLKIFKAHAINWGSWESILATKLLANEAITDGAQRLTLLSGVSYTSKSELEINSFLNSLGEQFDSSEVVLGETLKHFRKRFTQGHRSFQLKMNFFGRLARRLSREFYGLTSGINPWDFLNVGQLSLGSAYWSVTAETYKKAMEYAAANPGFDEYFKKIECADESYFQSLFRQVSSDYVNSGTTYVKWAKRGSPQPLTIDDLVVARQDPNKYFVRKIYSKDVELIEYLDEVWRG